MNSTAAPDVDGLTVADRGQFGIDPGGLGCHCEKSGHAQGHPGRHGCPVQPKGHLLNDKIFISKYVRTIRPI